MLMELRVTGTLLCTTLQMSFMASSRVALCACRGTVRADLILADSSTPGPIVSISGQITPQMAVKNVLVGVEERPRG